MNNPEKLTNKRQRIPKGQLKMNNPEKLTNKRQRIPKGQSGYTRRRKTKHNTICVEHHVRQTNRNKVNKT